MRVPLATAASICGVKPATFRKWVQRKHITRHTDDCILDDPRCTGIDFYDVNELLQWVDARNGDALWTRAGIAGSHATRLNRTA